MFWVLTKRGGFDIIIEHVAELCNGSTTDSDSVCEGSNPSSATNIEVPEIRDFLLRGVAQLGRALRSGRRSRWFKSSHLDQNGNLGGQY